MRKILIVGDFSNETSDVNSFLAQHFHTQLCTNSAKIVRSMLKLYVPDLVLMDIDDFDLYHPPYPGGRVIYRIARCFPADLRREAEGASAGTLYFSRKTRLGQGFVHSF